MARSHYWQYILNSEGQPLGGAVIRVFRTLSSDPIILYTQSAGGDPVPSVTSRSDGFFEFWVPDIKESGGGYSTNDTFKLVASGSTMLETTITDLQFLFKPPRMWSESMVSTAGFPLSAHGDGTIYSKKFVHNLNTRYPFIQVWNTSTNTLYPVSCSSVSVSSTIVSAVGGGVGLSSLPIRVVFLGYDDPIINNEE